MTKIIPTDEMKETLSCVISDLILEVLKKHEDTFSTSYKVKTRL